MSALSQSLVAEVTAILPVTQEDLLFKGVTAAIAERLVELKRVSSDLARKHGSLDALQRRIDTGGVPPDDHSLYTDLLEWRAVDNELAALLRILRAL